MSNIFKNIEAKKLISPPSGMSDNIHWLVLMGSHAYGCHTEDSDFDVYGFYMPRREMLFPHLAGIVHGFDHAEEKANEEALKTWQIHHIYDKETDKEYDFKILNIIKYFDLARDGNPDVIDSLFVPDDCVLQRTTVGDMIRQANKLFFSKDMWETYRGYAYKQLNKMDNKDDNEVIDEIRKFEEKHNIPRGIKLVDVQEAIKENKLKLSNTKVLKGNDLKVYLAIYERLIAQSKRYESVKVLGYDPKFAYHIVRLINEIEQVMIEGELDLRRNNEMYKDIRRGNWSIGQIRTWFKDREKDLNTIYANCKIIPEVPNTPAIKQLMMNCLEHHYGSLEKCVANPDKHLHALREINTILHKALN